MQDIDTTSTQSLIDRYYQEEQAQREKEQSLASLTVRLDAADLSMLNIVAKRFRKTRDDIVQDLLSNALVDLFARIDASERKLMARDADEAAKSIADEIAEENGVHSIEFKTGVWATHDRNITKIERKKAKLVTHESAADNHSSQALSTNASDDPSERHDNSEETEQASNDARISEQPTTAGVATSASVFA